MQWRGLASVEVGVHRSAVARACPGWRCDPADAAHSVLKTCLVAPVGLALPMLLTLCGGTDLLMAPRWGCGVMLLTLTVAGLPYAFSGGDPAILHALQWRGGLLVARGVRPCRYCSPRSAAQTCLISSHILCPPDNWPQPVASACVASRPCTCSCTLSSPLPDGWGAVALHLSCRFVAS
jgi:hypothetical protein